MTNHESALSELAALLAGTDASLTTSLRDILAAALQELIEAELPATIGAALGERTPERIAQRNGHRPKVLSTAAGDVEVGIPKLRTGSFFPELLEPRRRIDRALWAVIMTAYITGTSTRKVDDLVMALGCDSGDLEVDRVPDLQGDRRRRRRAANAGSITSRSCTSGWTRPMCTCASTVMSPPKRS